MIKSVSGTYVNSSSRLVLALAGEKVTPSTDGTAFKIRYAFSQARLTGHDFLSIGTGNATETNYPGTPSIPPSQANEVIETYPGRVFYVSTDQDGNFRVGDYFKVDQATGSATLNANAFDLSGLTSLRLGSIGAQLGELVSEFSSDDTLSGNSNSAVPTEAAVRNYFPQVATNIIPVADNVQDLGSPSKRWAHVYVGPGSVTIGSLTLTDNSGAFTVSSSSATPPTLSVPEINTGSIRYFQNNIIGGNSNEDIVIDTSGTGKLQVLADLNMTGTLSGPATFNIDPAAVGDNTGTVVIKGNLQVDGTTTTVNSTPLTVADKNIVLGSGAANDAAADGSGITVESGAGNKTFNWVDATDAWTSSEHLNLLTGKTYEINGTAVLTSSEVLGSPTTATLAGAATTLGIGGSSGTLTIGNATITATNATTLNLNGASPAITTTSSGTANVFTTNALTGNLFSAATTVTLGYTSTSGSTHNIATGAVGSGNTKTVNIGTGAAAGSTTTVNIGSSTGTATAQIYGKLAVMGSSTGSVTFQAAASAGSATYVLPTALPGTTGFALVSDTSGNMSWAAAGTNIPVSSDTSTTTLYPAMSTSNSGNLTTIKINSNFTFNGVTNTLTVTALTESSSIMLKENVNPLTNALDSILQLCGVSYDRRDGSRKNEVGLIAEEVNKIIPNLVTKNATGDPEGIQYTKLTAYLVEAIKSLKAEIDELKGNK